MSMVEVSFTRDDLKRVVWTAIQAFVAVFVLGVGDVLNAFTHEGSEVGASALLALCGAALAGAVSAIKNLVLSDQSSIK